MLVSHIIEELQTRYKPTDRILIGYWTKDFIQDMVVQDFGYKLTDEEYEDLCEYDYNWESINTQISELANELIEEQEEKEDTELLDTELWDTETEQDNVTNSR